jgi:hypothetical protein
MSIYLYILRLTKTFMGHKKRADVRASAQVEGLMVWRCASYFFLHGGTGVDRLKPSTCTFVPFTLRVYGFTGTIFKPRSLVFMTDLLSRREFARPPSRVMPVRKDCHH